MMKLVASAMILLTIIFTPILSFAEKIGRQYMIQGKTMGTYYSLKIVSKKALDISVWQSKVNTQLKELNKKLSMYDPDSELSAFNRHPVQSLMQISQDFFTILSASRTMYHLSNGAWDGTVKPIVDLWGFGSKKKNREVPKAVKINMALSMVGFYNITLPGQHIALKRKNVTLDLGSIAKGYGVDAIARLFLSSNIRNILIEIGGELFASGVNQNGKIWRVGILQPEKTCLKNRLYKIVQLEDRAIATSGSYRNYFEKNGEIYSHIIDPKTGYPVKNQIVSASVISKDCTYADGLATALMVMDLNKGLSLINALEDTECLIIQKKKDAFVSHLSKNFSRYVVD